MNNKFIECAKCRKLIPIDEIADHSKEHSEQGTLLESNSELKKDEILNNHKESIKHMPISDITHKENRTNSGLVVMGIILLFIGLSFLLGSYKYWAIIPFVLGFTVIILSVVNNIKSDKRIIEKDKPDIENKQNSDKLE
jgi:hypothetical protein